MPVNRRHPESPAETLERSYTAQVADPWLTHPIAMRMAEARSASLRADMPRLQKWGVEIEEPAELPVLTDAQADAANEVHRFYIWLCLICLFFGVLVGLALAPGGLR